MGKRRAFCVLLAVLTALAIGFAGCSIPDAGPSSVDAATPHSENSNGAGFSLSEIPPYSGSPSVEVNGNKPYFADDELTFGPLEDYSELDDLGRCGTATAVISLETIPTIGRGSIGMIKPSGWQIAEYDWIDGTYLYNRCHLIAYALTGENDNPLNLITGTRSMNVQGMLPYEQRVASYVESTGNHVLYRATPVFEGNNLVASGVLLEAESVEDSGRSVRFCVWCYNVEPGVIIDYATGNNQAGDPIAETYETRVAEQDGEEAIELTYILNTHSHRFHYPDCPSVAKMSDKNKLEFTGTRQEAIDMGYEPCGECRP